VVDRVRKRGGESERGKVRKKRKRDSTNAKMTNREVERVGGFAEILVSIDLNVLSWTKTPNGVHCNTLQRTAMHCNTKDNALRCTATH